MTTVRNGSGIPSSFARDEKLVRDITSEKRASRIKTLSTQANVFGIKAPEVRISVDRYTLARRAAAARITLYRENLNGGMPPFQGWVLIEAEHAADEGTSLEYTPAWDERNEFHSDIILPDESAPAGDIRREHMSRLAELSTWLGFTHFKRRKRGNPPFGGTEWRGVPVHQGRWPTVRNPPTPATGGDAPGRWRLRKWATACRTRPRCVGRWDALVAGHGRLGWSRRRGPAGQVWCGRWPGRTTSAGFPYPDGSELPERSPPVANAGQTTPVSGSGPPLGRCRAGPGGRRRPGDRGSAPSGW